MSMCVGGGGDTHQLSLTEAIAQAINTQQSARSLAFKSRVELVLDRKVQVDDTGTLRRVWKTQVYDNHAQFPYTVQTIESEGITFTEHFQPNPRVMWVQYVSDLSPAQDVVDVLITQNYRGLLGRKTTRDYHDLRHGASLLELGNVLRMNHSQCKDVEIIRSWAGWLRGLIMGLYGLFLSVGLYLCWVLLWSTIQPIFK